MWEIFSFGGPPYNGLTNNQAREKIDTGEGRNTVSQKDRFCFLKKCWRVEELDILLDSNAQSELV